MSGVLAGLIGSFPAGAAGAFESIASASGTGSSGTITFSSIPSTYQHLQIRGTADSSGAGTQQDLFITLNGVTSASYTWHQMRATGTGVSPSGGVSLTNASVYDAVTGNSALANVTAAIILDIHDYASTTKNKTLRLFGGFDNNGSGQLVLHSNLLINTSAISSISLISGGGANWETTTQFALYGIKGAA
jgi:hypothetical protein